jgi:hypothetical protein
VARYAARIFEVSGELSAEAFSRWFLAGFFVVVAVFYTTKTLMMKKRLGRSPVSLGARGSRDFVIYGTFRVFRAAILLVCVGLARSTPASTPGDFIKSRAAPVCCSSIEANEL